MRSVNIYANILHPAGYRIFYLLMKTSLSEIEFIGEKVSENHTYSDRADDLNAFKYALETGAFVK